MSVTPRQPLLLGNTTAQSLDMAGQAAEKNMGFGSAAGYDNLNYTSYNPAVAGSLRSFNASLSYLNFDSDLNFFYANLVYPLSEEWKLLTRFNYMNMPSLTDIETGRELKYNELFAGAGAAYTFGQRLSLAGVAHFYRTRIADYTGSTFYGDLGMSYITGPSQARDKVILGASLLHLGPGIKFNQEPSSLPLNFNLGLQYIRDFNYRLMAGLRKYEAYKPFLFSVGGEMRILNLITLRASLINDVNNNIKYNFGLGFDLEYSDYHFILDYAFLPTEEVAAASVISLTFRMPVPDRDREKEASEKSWKNMWKSE